MRHSLLRVLWLCVIGLLVSNPTLTPAAIPVEALAGHWRFDSVRDGRAADLSPSGNPLVLDRAAFHAENGTAQSLACDGFEVGGRLEERQPLVFKTGLTLAIWVWPTRTRGHELLFGRPNPTPTWTTPTTGLFLTDARPGFGMFGASKKLVVEGPALPLRTWSLLVVTADGRTVTLSVNGRKVAENVQSIPFPAPGNLPWFVGRAATQYFRGRLGEALVWTRALTAAEVTAVHADTAPRYAGGEASTATANRSSTGDRTVDVESPGSRPTGGTWIERPTRTLAGLNGFVAHAPLATDRWGGRTDRPAQRATGFFRTELVDGRWWLVTPEGHLFWNVGVNTVRPAKSATAAAVKAFPTTTTRELRALGFNGLGNGSATSLQTAADALPWSIRLNFISSFAQHHKQTYATSGHTGYTEQCFPVFHPDFPAWARRHADTLTGTLADPSVLGIFTDNELQSPADLLDRHLRLPAEDPYLRHGRAAAHAWLAAEGLPADPARLTLKDRYRFIAHVFATYARIVHDAIRAVDGHHLIFGPRFNNHRGQFDNPWFWPAVGPWIDVVAVNYYALWGPQRDEIQEWSTATKRPIILTEWYSKAADAPGLANTNGAGWFVRTQADRAKYYQHFVLAACETPALVGFHYFKYLDDDSDSVALDSAGGANKGICRADGSPWAELQDAAGAVNRQVYPLIDFFGQRQRQRPTPPAAVR